MAELQEKHPNRQPPPNILGSSSSYLSHSEGCQERESHTKQDKCQKKCTWGEGILWGGKGETRGERSA